MKKLLILLLLPLFSFSQTFDELMTINSGDTFKRVAIENDYELDSEREGNIYYWVLDGSKSQMEAIYFKEENKVLFRFHKEEVLGHKTQFKEITKNIKSKCQYDRITGDVAYYKCPDNIYLLPFFLEQGEIFYNQWDEKITKKDGYQYKYIEGVYYRRPAGIDVNWTKLTNESGKEIGFYTSDGTGFVILML
tara:strand:+ start:597 stop:1172 length:576 start_codon:yes stop_codon:yes gene_type:complete